MPSPTPIDGWPEYLPSAPDHIYAIGVIALKYGQLEEILRRLFQSATIMRTRQVVAIFYRLPNDVRLDAIKEIMAATRVPNDLKELTRHFLKGFETCASNRHGLMHSHYDITYTDPVANEEHLVLSKFSRAGRRFECALDLREKQACSAAFNPYCLRATVTFYWRLRFFRQRRKRFAS